MIRLLCKILRGFIKKDTGKQKKYTRITEIWPLRIEAAMPFFKATFLFLYHYKFCIHHYQSLDLCENSTTDMWRNQQQSQILTLLSKSSLPHIYLFINSMKEIQAKRSKKNKINIFSCSQKKHALFFAFLSYLYRRQLMPQSDTGNT